MEFSLYDHQRVLALDLRFLTGLAGRALPLVMGVPGEGVSVLGGLEEVEVSFLMDEAMGRVHGEFLGDAAPTDVMTFLHGEILISTETAVRQAGEYGTVPLREVALYLIHGLLHLHGHEDGTAAGFERMRELQEGVLEAVWEGGGVVGN